MARRAQQTCEARREILVVDDDDDNDDDGGGGDWSQSVRIINKIGMSNLIEECMFKNRY